MISINYWRAGTAPGARCNNFSAQEVLHTRQSGGQSTDNHWIEGSAENQPSSLVS